MSGQWRVRVVSKESDLEPQDIQLLDNSQLYEQRDWFRYFERLAPGCVRYVVIEFNGASVGLACLRIVYDNNVLSLYNVAELLGEHKESNSDAGLFPCAVVAITGAHGIFRTSPDTFDGSPTAVLANAVRENCSSYLSLSTLNKICPVDCSGEHCARATLDRF
jgi:hypothetical protein